MSGETQSCNNLPVNNTSNIYKKRESKIISDSSISTYYKSLNNFTRTLKKQKSLNKSLHKEKTNKNTVKRNSLSLNKRNHITIIRMKMELNFCIEYSRDNKNTNEKESLNNSNSFNISIDNTSNTTINSSKIQVKKKIESTTKNKNINQKKTGEKIPKENYFINFKIPPINKEDEKVSIDKNETSKEKKNENPKRKSKKEKYEEYNCNKDISLFRKVPPKIPFLLKNEINLKTKNNISLSNNYYGKISKKEISNVFYNHLIINEKNDNQNFLSSSIIKRNKGKLLMIIYFKSQNK